MSKAIVLIFIMIGFVQSSLAQRESKKSTYNRWAKRGIIEVVYAYMQDTDSIVGDPEKEGRKLYKKTFIDTNSTSLDSISIFLKNNNWKETEERIFQPLLYNYKKGNPLDSVFFVSLPPKGNQWNIKVKEILSRYPRHKEAPQHHQARSRVIIFLCMISSFLAGLLIGGGLIYTISKKRIDAILYGEEWDKKKLIFKCISKPFKFKYLDKVSTLKEQKDSHEKDSENKESSFRKLKDDFKRSEYENKELGKQIDEQNDTTQSFETYSDTVDEPPKSPTEIYFGMPNPDGSFPISNGEFSYNEKKFFKIEYDEWSTRGKLSFLSGERDQRAINRLGSYLNPVCDIENISQRETSKNIKVIKDGTVSLINNDRWVIDTNNKIKIRLT